MDTRWRCICHLSDMHQDTHSFLNRFSRFRWKDSVLSCDLLEGRGTEETQLCSQSYFRIHVPAVSVDTAAVQPAGGAAVKASRWCYSAASRGSIPTPKLPTCGRSSAPEQPKFSPIFRFLHEMIFDTVCCCQTKKRTRKTKASEYQGERDKIDTETF